MPYVKEGWHAFAKSISMLIEKPDYPLCVGLFDSDAGRSEIDPYG